MIVNQHNFDIKHFDQSLLIEGAFKSKGIERKRHLQQAMPHAVIAGYILEFGVYRGKTINHISSHWPGQSVWGFDSFQGLPEPWFVNDQSHPSHPAGTFDLTQEGLPAYPINVKLVKGWFDQSIPPWLDSNPGPIKFLHVDCDLYSSTLTVLNLLNQSIVPGTVIVFDEFYPWGNSKSYDLWAQGEYQALKEWTAHNNRQFTPLLHSSHQQCSIIMIK
jgi:hypothetical protein